MASDVLLSAFNGFEDSVILRQLPWQLLQHQFLHLLQVSFMIFDFQRLGPDHPTGPVNTPGRWLCMFENLDTQLVPKTVDETHRQKLELGPWDWCWFMWISWWCQVRKQAPWPKIAQPTYITLQNLQGFCQGSSSHSHSFSWSLRTSAAALHWFPRGLGELVPPISAHLAVVEVARKQLTTTRPDMWGRYSWNNWLILKKVEQVGREKGERKGWDGMGSSTSPAAFLFYTYKYMYIYIYMYVFIYVYIYIYIYIYKCTT